MQEELKALARRVLPHRVVEALFDGIVTMHAALERPANRLRAGRAGRERATNGADPSSRSCRLFAYNPALLPNALLAEIENGTTDTETAK